MLFCRFALLISLGFTVTTGAQARMVESPDYHHAFSSLDSGSAQSVENMVNRGSDSILNEVLRGTLMARPSNTYSFAELNDFVTEHPDWPNLRGILMITEQKIPANASSEQIVNWFNAHPPFTGIGFYRYIDALNMLGQTTIVPTLVKARWVNHDFSPDEIAAFQARFAPLLTAQDHQARLDRLLWANNIGAARGMYSVVSAGAQAVAEARIAMANQLSKASALLSRVPASRQNDPGLLFERLREAVRSNDDQTALDILLRAPEDLGQPESWWNQRNIMIRRVMDRRDYTLAYRLAANHGLDAGFNFTQAEFVAGWLALRFLNRPDLAHHHFAALLEKASTPMSRARGAYWLGRTLEVEGDKTEAEQTYEMAAALNTTFYGQLATTRLYAAPTLVAATEPPIPANVRAQFYARDVIMAAQHLNRIGQTARAETFFRAAQNYATQRVEFVLLMELAYHLQRPDWVIGAAKAAAQKNMLVEAGAFPILSTPMPTPPDPAFTHALIRQESLFNTDAGSPVGARGLMQLMPGTAKEEAKKLGLPFRAYRLTDPEYNLRLGTSFVQSQLNQFNGSIVLALAAYNAGAHRVHEWMQQYGDPRTPQVDPIDWIEMIPVYETRNYVQRIIENLQFYRARLNGGHAPLMILKDLRK